MSWFEKRQIKESVAASALCFDHRHELLWSGGQHGRLTSYVLDPGLATVYTRFAANTIAKPTTRMLPQHYMQLQSQQVVLSIMDQDHGVYSLSTQSLHFSTREGLSRWHLK